MIKNTFVVIIISFILINHSSYSQNSQNNESKKDKKLKPNHLIDEKSPYLLQHAYNPVDWYPWGGKAFQKAKKENKPIFLSIGYSTCHWCHVMEHESFEDEEIASLMNETFVNIKVDREERPDIDGIYMEVCQIMTGSGGWPLTIIMSPNKEPFFAGTYFPKESKFGRMGMKELIENIDDAWKNNPDAITQTTNSIKDYFENKTNSKPKDFNTNIFQNATKQFKNIYDHIYGGFGKAPKFPTPHNLMYLLRWAYHNKDSAAAEMVEHTLLQMRNGGIYDQIGFGYHRYSTDKEWLLPHFEKMLYDQALMTIANTEAYLLTKNPKLKEISEEILTYVSRDMTDKQGGFYSAEDADSEKIEGKFYVWEISEINEILNKDEAAFFIDIFNLRKNGNYTEEAQGHGAGGNIPHLRETPDEIATKYSISKLEVKNKIQFIRKQLYDHREKRVHPYKDDKILTDWNSLMIVAYAKAGRAFDNPQYIKIAEKAYSFISKNLMNTDGSLSHRYRDGHAGITATIDDYAYLTWALLELYESTYNIEYLKKSIELLDYSVLHFWDNKNGGFYFTSNDAEELLTRKKEIYDGATPSGNSVQLSNLMKIGKITAKTNYSDLAEQLIKIFTQQVENSPSAFSMFNIGAMLAYEKSFEIVVVGDFDSNDTQNILKELNKNYLPNKVVVFRSDDDNAEIIKYADYTKLQYTIGDKATVYVCKNYACENPTNDINTMLKHLGLNN